MCLCQRYHVTQTEDCSRQLDPSIRNNALQIWFLFLVQRSPQCPSQDQQQQPLLHQSPSLTLLSTSHRASTSMYSLTFRVRITTSRSMDKMERRTQQARRCYRRRGESSPACVVCCMCAACGGPGGLLLGSATHFHSVAIATQPVHRLQIRSIVHNYGALLTTPPSYIRVRAILWACGRGQTDTQTHRRA